jgi:hypothetical protein
MMPITIATVRAAAAAATAHVEHANATTLKHTNIERKTSNANPNAKKNRLSNANANSSANSSRTSNNTSKANKNRTLIANDTSKANKNRTLAVPNARKSKSASPAPYACSSKSKSASPAPYTCPECHTVLTSAPLANEHIKAHLQQLPTRAPLPSNLQLIVHNFKLSQCPECLWYFSTTTRQQPRKHNPCVSASKQELQDSPPHFPPRQPPTLNPHSRHPTTPTTPHQQLTFPPFPYLNTPTSTSAPPPDSPFASTDCWWPGQL